MVDAHIDAMLALAEPFQCDTYFFGDQTVTQKIQRLIPVMLDNRTTPPPEATYSLNRKLSGAFLLCARLQSQVACHRVLDDVLLFPDGSQKRTHLNG